LQRVGERSAGEVGVVLQENRCVLSEPLSGQPVSTWETSDLVASLFSRVGPAAARIAEEVQRGAVQVRVYVACYATPDARPGLSLPPELVGKLAALGAHFDHDVFILPGAEE
jgi:hypothetical protein